MKEGDLIVYKNGPALYIDMHNYRDYTIFVNDELKNVNVKDVKIPTSEQRAKFEKQRREMIKKARGQGIIDEKTATSANEAIDYLRSKFGLNSSEPDSITGSDSDENDEYIEPEFDDFENDWDDEFSVFSEEDEEIEIEDSASEDNEDDLEENNLTERVQRKKVIRNGKRVIKWKTNKPGYRVVKSGNRIKEVRMTPQEKLKRKRAQRKASVKRKVTMNMSKRKRARSIKKRVGLGIH
jgi:hypothetical protein